MGEDQSPNESGPNDSRWKPKHYLSLAAGIGVGLLLILQLTTGFLDSLTIFGTEFKFSESTPETTATIAPVSEPDATVPPAEVISEAPTLASAVPAPSEEEPSTEVSAIPAQSEEDAYTIAISEVMFTPCGGMLHERRWSEYVELYNYGDKEVDVAGWLLSDGGEPNSGQPDRIITWDERLESVFIGNDLVTDSTIIPPKSHAIILAPTYKDGEKPYQNHIPSTTMILTVMKPSTLLGDDDGGLVAYMGFDPDVLVLYEGSSSRIDRVISTYGLPIVTVSPFRLKKGGGNSFPFTLEDCGSVARIVLDGPDVEGNWEVVPWDGRSPGYSP